MNAQSACTHTLFENICAFHTCCSRHADRTVHLLRCRHKKSAQHTVSRLIFTACVRVHIRNLSACPFPCVDTIRARTRVNTPDQLVRSHSSIHTYRVCEHAYTRTFFRGDTPAFSLTSAIRTLASPCTAYVKDRGSVSTHTGNVCLHDQ